MVSGEEPATGRRNAFGESVFDVIISWGSGDSPPVHLGAMPEADPPPLDDSAVDDSTVDDSNPNLIDDQHGRMGHDLSGAELSGRRSRRLAERFSYEVQELMRSARNTNDLAGAQWLAAEFRKLEDRYAPRPPQPDPDAFGREYLRDVRAALDELMRNYDQSPATDAEPPAGWYEMWWWARLYGVDGWVADYLDLHGRLADEGDPWEQRWEPPGDDEFPDLRRLGDLNLSTRDRLDALVRFVELLDPEGDIAKTDPGYGISHAAAKFLSGGGTFEDIDRLLAGSQTPVDSPLASSFEPYQPGRIDDLLAEFEAGEHSPLDLPEAWITMWAWGQVFGVDEELDELLEQRRRLLGVELFERPTVEQVESIFGQAAGAEPAADSEPPRLFAIINHYERIDPSIAIPSGPAYLAIRDLAVGSSGLTLDDINRALRGLPPLSADDGARAVPIEPPTMTVPAPPTGGEQLKADDPHALKPEVASGELDPGDSAVGDAAGTDEPAQDGDPDDDEGGAIDIGPIPEMKLDEGARASRDDSAVDDSEDVYLMVGPKPVIADSGHEDSSDQGDSDEAAAVGGRSGGRRRIAIGAAAVAAAVIAIVASLALFGGGNESPDVLASEPSAPAGQPVATEPAGGAEAETPTPEPTEEPTMQIGGVADLVICDQGRSSFSGFRQPDGTYLDENGDPISCPE